MSLRLHETHGRIVKPGKVLLHHIPLRFVHMKVAGGAKKAMNMEIPLVPFIDFLITLVVFLLMSFSASGELVAQQATIRLPNAGHTTALEIAPIIAVDARVITLDGNRVADTASLMQSAQIDRIEPLIQQLEVKHRNWQVLHPGQDFPAMVIMQADHRIDFRVIKKVMYSCAAAGYANISFAVNATGE